MNLTIYHINNKPIDSEHRKNAAKEWQDYASEILTTKPNVDDHEAWKKINEQLDVKELEIRTKYPHTQELTLNSLKDLDDLLTQYKSLSLCLEKDDKIALYIMD
jgi:hypothetical protein